MGATLNIFDAGTRAGGLHAAGAVYESGSDAVEWEWADFCALAQGSRARSGGLELDRLSPNVPSINNESLRIICIEGE